VVEDGAAEEVGGGLWYVGCISLLGHLEFHGILVDFLSEFVAKFDGGHQILSVLDILRSCLVGC